MKAYETVWFVGDQFLTRSYQPYFGAKENTYVNEHFESLVYMNNKFACNDRSVLSRLRNCIVYGINHNYLLPKAIIIVADNDILKAVQFEGFEISVLLGKIMEWIGNEIYRIISGYKDSLPKKAVKEHFPQILWIEPPLHKNFSVDDNDRRKKFAKALSDTAKLFQNMTVLQLRKVWQYDDDSYYLKGAQHFMADGYAAYFSAIDTVIKLWDTFLYQWMVKKAGKTADPTLVMKTTENDTSAVEDDEQTRGNKKVASVVVPRRQFKEKPFWKRKPFSDKYRWCNNNFQSTPYDAGFRRLLEPPR